MMFGRNRRFPCRFIICKLIRHQNCRIRSFFCTLLKFNMFRGISERKKYRRIYAGCDSKVINVKLLALVCPPPAEVSRSDGGGRGENCRDCSPSNPTRRVCQTRPTFPPCPCKGGQKTLRQAQRPAPTNRLSDRA